MIIDSMPQRNFPFHKSCLWYVMGLCLAVSVWGQTPDILPKVQEKTGKSRILPLAHGRFQLKTSAHPEKSSRFIEAMILEKAARLERDGQDETIMVEVLLGKIGDPLFDGLPLPPEEVSREESYGIRFFEKAGVGRICLFGHDNRGVFYAGATFLQMMQEGRIVLEEVHDYPHWRQRYLSDYYIPPAEQLIRYAAELKNNGYGMQYRSGWKLFEPQMKPPYTPDTTWQKQLERLKQFQEETGNLLDFMFVYNIYAGADSRSFDCADPEHLARLVNQCRFALKHGFTHVMIGVDDFVPQKAGEYQFVSEAEKRKFDNVGAVHGFLMTTLEEQLRGEFPGAVFSFCPGPYTIDSHNAGQEPGRTYLRRLGESLPQDVAVVWTGRHVVSQRIAKADFDVYSTLVGKGRRIFTWHNPDDSAYPPGKLDFYPEFEQDTNGIMFTNSHDYGVQGNRPTGAVYMEYLWNPQGFAVRDSYLRAVRHTLLQDETAALNFVTMREKCQQAKQTVVRPQKAQLLREAQTLLESLKPFGVPRYGALEKQLSHELDMATAPLPVLEAVHTSLEVIVDGRLNEEAWEHAGIFEIRDREGLVHGEGRMLWNEDAQTIYVAARLPKARFTEEVLARDDAMQGHDGIRLFFNPPLKTPRYAEIAIDTDGNLRDGILYVPKWDPDITFAVKRSGEDCIIELALPIAHMKNTPVLWETYRLKRGSEWRFQAMRPADETRNRGQLEDAIWAPVGETSAMEIGRYGILRFK